MPKRRIASEVTAELLRDPAYVARMEAQRRAREERQAQSRLEQEGLITALAKVGITVETVWDLVNRNDPYPQAIPILVESLKMPYAAKTREGIVRALTVKEARGQAGVPLLAILQETPIEQEDFRWVIANALTRASSADMFQPLTDAMSTELDTMVKKRLETALRSLPKNESKGTEK